MPKRTGRQKGLTAIRAVCQGILDLTQEMGADPVEIVERLLSVSLLLHPAASMFRNPKTRQEAGARFAEMVAARWEAVERSWRGLTAEERRSISRGR